MNKAKIALTTSCIIVACAGALAFRTVNKPVYIFNNHQTQIVTFEVHCLNIGTGCNYTSENGNTFQIYFLSKGIYYPEKE